MSNDENIQLFAMYVFCDLIEHIGPPSLELRPRFQELFAKGLNLDSELCQAAAFGFGIMAEKGGEGYADLCKMALPVLTQLLNDPRSKEEDEKFVRDNAIAAYVRISNAPFCGVEPKTAVETLLKWLPISADTEEVAFVYSSLIKLVKANQAALTPELLTGAAAACQQILDSKLLEDVPSETVASWKEFVAAYAK